jgi:hypothetical protein
VIVWEEYTTVDVYVGSHLKGYSVPENAERWGDGFKLLTEVGVEASEQKMDKGVMYAA